MAKLREPVSYHSNHAIVIVTKQSIYRSIPGTEHEGKIFNNH